MDRSNKSTKQSFVLGLCLCLASALLLGFAQPFTTPQWLGRLPEWQRYLGLLSLVGYVPLFLLLDRSSLRASFWWASISVSLQYSIILFWIYIALNVYGHVPFVPATLITYLLALLMGVKAGLFFSLGKYLSLRFNKPFVFFAPVVLCALEYFRNFYVFGGFPWGNAGYSIARIDVFLQIASVFGVYGLVFYVGVINSCCYAVVTAKSFRLKKMAGAIALILVGAGAIFGAVRLNNGKNEFAKSIRVAALQGNIAQEIKSASRAHATEILATYQELHEQAVQKEVDLIVWPESAYPSIIDEDTAFLNLGFESKVFSIIGATTVGDSEECQNDFHAHNSALLENQAGAIKKRYDKGHLVPFGEYVPWPFGGMVDQVVPGMGAFLPGTKYTPQKLELSNMRDLLVGTTVCYEGIFPEISRTYANKGAALLVNITNDAWYGASSAPYQHLLMYKLRSVESGLPFVRATNNGVSAIIDAYGRIKDELLLNEKNILINDIPLVNKATIYRVVGDIVPIVCLWLLLLCYFWAVLPIKNMFYRKKWLDLAVIGLTLCVLVMINIYYSQGQFVTDESAATKKLWLSLLLLLALVGAFSNSPITEKILRVSTYLVAIFSLLWAYFETPFFLFGLLYAVLIYLMAKRIKALKHLPR